MDPKETAGVCQLVPKFRGSPAFDTTAAPLPRKMAFLVGKLSARGFGPQTGNPLSGGDPERDVNRADWGILRSHLESRVVSTKNNLPKDTT